jgi:hypothetical protein
MPDLRKSLREQLATAPKRNATITANAERLKKCMPKLAVPLEQAGGDQLNSGGGPRSNCLFRGEPDGRVGREFAIDQPDTAQQNGFVRRQGHRRAGGVGHAEEVLAPGETEDAVCRT